MKQEYAVSIHLIKTPIEQKTFQEKLMFRLQEQFYTLILIKLLTGHTKDFLKLSQKERTDPHQAVETFVGTKEACQLELIKLEKNELSNIKEKIQQIKNNKFFRRLQKKKRDEINLILTNEKQSQLEKSQAFLLKVGINLYLDVKKVKK